MTYKKNNKINSRTSKRVGKLISQRREKGLDKKESRLVTNNKGRQDMFLYDPKE